MSGIRSKNTTFEKEVFHELKKVGLRFRTHYTGVIGKPDIAVPSKKKVVFIDSDFWHGWRYPSWSFSTNKIFWNKKILANKARDVLVTRKLRRLGWGVLRVWEHQLKKDRGGTIKKIEKFLNRI